MPETKALALYNAHVMLSAKGEKNMLNLTALRLSRIHQSARSAIIL